MRQTFFPRLHYAGKEKKFCRILYETQIRARGIPTTFLTPDLCPTISKPHTTRENLGEVGGDRPLGIVGSTVFSSAGEALKQVKNRGRNAKQICGSLCFRDAKNRFRTGNLTGNRGGNRWPGIGFR